MNKRYILLLIALLFASLGCGLFGRGAAEPAALPTPTPPPIPTRIPTAQPSSTPPPSPTLPPTLPPQLARFIYGSVRDGVMAIYMLDNTASFVTRLPLDESIRHAVWPKPSPDGSQIAFVATTSDFLSNGIYVVGTDGTRLTQLTAGDGTFPDWSPDGTRIAYECEQRADICVMDANGKNVVNLTADGDSLDRYPSWTPDERIVFMSTRDWDTEASPNTSSYDIYIMDADGSDVTRLTENEDDDRNPDVSPDGTRIAFESSRDVGVGSEIYIMGIDGSNVVRLTSDTAWNQNPIWSPDGTQVMFASNYGDGNLDPYIMNADGTGLTRLTHNAGEDGGLRLGHGWLPEMIEVDNVTVEERTPTEPRLPSGTGALENRILFAANSFNCDDCLESGLYRVNFDGMELTQLPVQGFHPAWAPDFTRMAYTRGGEIYVANSDGSDETQLTSAYRAFRTVAWPPNESYLLGECRPYGQSDTCLVDLATGIINNLTEVITYDWGVPFPSWSPENKIVSGASLLDLTGQVIGTLPVAGRISPDEERLVTIIDDQIVVMNIDGSEQVQITTDAPLKGFPVWSPDSQLLLYTVAPGDGRIYLYTIQANGNSPRQLVSQPISLGPEEDEPLLTYLGYSWAP